MKVCDLTQFYSPLSGGVKRYLEEKRKYAEAAGHDHILIIPGPKTETVATPQARTYSIAAPLVSQTSRYRVLLNLNAVETILESERPDVIESSDPYQVAWKAIASGEALRIPVVGFYHSHFPEAYLRTTVKYFGKTASDIMMDVVKHYVRSLYNHFTHTFVSSLGLAQVLREWGVENTVLCELGVNTDTFHAGHDRDQTRATLPMDPKRRLLLYVGRLAPEKNVKTLFAAFSLLEEQLAPGRFALLVIGDGPQREHLLELQKRTGAVTWINYCSDQAQLARYYRAADLFVHPGVQETFGLVALESQACGTPVVGIRGSYMDRIIFADQSYWAAENSPGSLASAILAINETDLVKAGLQASKRVAARYSWNSVFRTMFDIYQQIRI